MASGPPIAKRRSSVSGHAATSESESIAGSPDSSMRSPAKITVRSPAAPGTETTRSASVWPPPSRAMVTSRFPRSTTASSTACWGAGSAAIAWSISVGSAPYSAHRREAEQYRLRGSPELRVHKIFEHLRIPRSPTRDRSACGSTPHASLRNRQSGARRRR